jgi:hypothetical protein
MSYPGSNPYGSGNNGSYYDPSRPQYPGAPTLYGDSPFGNTGAPSNPYGSGGNPYGQGSSGNSNPFGNGAPSNPYGNLISYQFSKYKI